MGVIKDEEEYSNEHSLADDYPVYYGYWYVVDGLPTKSDIRGTVLDLKRKFGGNVTIRRCNAIARGLL